MSSLTIPLNCPHCQAPDPGDGAFCTRCGMALPQPSSPRIVRGKDLASSATGQNLQAQQLIKKARSASTTFFVLAVLQLLFAAFAVIVGLNLDSDGIKGPDGQAINGDMLIVGGAVIGVLGLIFFALGIWARRSPLPAAITGLTLYVTVLLADAALDPTSLARGLLIKIVIIAFLIKAISAGFQHRALLRKMKPV